MARFTLGRSADLIDPERSRFAGPGWSGAAVVWRELVSHPLLPLAVLGPAILESLMFLAVKLGVFDDRLGSVVRVGTTVGAFIGLIGLHARRLRRIDLERRGATRSFWATHEALRTQIAYHEQTEAELRAGEERYRLLAEAMPQIVWTSQADGSPGYVNRRWTTCTGLTLEQAQQSGWLPILHPDDHDHSVKLWEIARQNGESYSVEFRIRQPGGGSYRWHLCRAEPMLDEAGKIVQWVGTFTDIDDQKRVEAELRSIQFDLEARVLERTEALEFANESLINEVAERKLAEATARSASRTKGEFLANMSHEIRTPMNGILGMTELTLATPLHPRQREYLSLAKASADALLTVIDDILDFSKIEAGKLTLDPIPFDLHQTVIGTLRTLAHKAHSKGIELACRIASGVPRDFVGDSGRLRQVLLNLVGNAIKFTPSGEVLVSMDEGANQGDPPRFSVADTGIGIPPEKRVAIFAPFEQADSSTTRRYGGTGLGLAISSRLIALMGGKLELVDNPGGGSLFRFSIRLEKTLDASPDPTRPETRVLNGVRVLVADDNKTHRQILKEILGRWHCRVTTAEGGSEAISLAHLAGGRGEPFDVVILDPLMPGLEGRVVAARLRDDPMTARARIVILTPLGTNEPTAGDAYGGDAWLNKPLCPAELARTLVDLIGQAPSPEPAPLIELEPPTPPRSRSLWVLLAEDHLVNQKVATRMLESQGHRVVVVANGREAVETSGAHPFDLILMDVQMPEMDGFEALSAIRARESLDGTHTRSSP